MSEDMEWVSRTLEGDQSAFDSLVEKYMDRSYAIALRLISDSDEARDVIQDAFLKAYRALRGFRGASSFFTWFCRILVNSCRDHLRKKRIRSQFLFSFTGHDDESGPGEDRSTESEVADPLWSRWPDRVLEQHEFTRAIRRALRKLPLRQRTVFVLKHFQDLRLAEIARILNISEGTVKAHLFRAVKALRQELREWTGDIS